MGSRCKTGPLPKLSSSISLWEGNLFYIQRGWGLNYFLLSWRRVRFKALIWVNHGATKMGFSQTAQNIFFILLKESCFLYRGIDLNYIQFSLPEELFSNTIEMGIQVLKDTSFQDVRQGPLKTPPTIHAIAIDLGACQSLRESNLASEDTRHIDHMICINKVGIDLEASSQQCKVLTMQAGRKRKGISHWSYLARNPVNYNNKPSKICSVV